VSPKRSAKALALAALAATAGACDGGRALAEKNGVLLDRVPPVAHPVTADLNAMVVYRGLDATPAVARPGQPLHLTHFWEVMSPPGTGWKVMTRLRGRGQAEVVADHEAGRGLYPVTRWQRGDVVRDEQEVTLPAAWSAPTVTVVVGLTNGPSRLPIIVGPRVDENHVIAATIPVQARGVRP
jgi:hypothetical protein